ncbi:hypothetical protein RF240_14915 [Dickeya dadantii]|uniref:hypothetical protein n=1 Tax=Dickeya dadantii TaxID=204038 RepID=UPI0035A93129
MWLQQRHHPVTAIDESLEAVDIMKRAGVKDARRADIWTMQREHFDTLLMLGRNIVIAGTLEGADKLLTHLHQLTGWQTDIVSQQADGHYLARLFTR